MGIQMEKCKLLGVAVCQRGRMWCSGVFVGLWGS